jgi:chlorite dismutase
MKSDSLKPSPSRRRFIGQMCGLGAVASGMMPTFLEAKDAMQTIANPRLFTFIGGDSGAWQVIARKTVIGEPLQTVKRLDIVIGEVNALWKLSGVTSNERYVTRPEKDQLAAKQVTIGRSEATHAAMIPIRKNSKWWALTQDERRAIFEESSHHIKIGMKYLPAIARRLHHCRDMAEPQPFDFITLFDYTKADANAFEDMVAELRTTEEWKYVEREIDIRMVREGK